MYQLKIKKNKFGYMPLMRGDKIATFGSLFSIRKYLRRYDKTLLQIVIV